MKEISKTEYETLLERGLRCIGKVMPYDTMTPEIYFTISHEESVLSARDIEKEISKSYNGFYGQFDVTCYWTPIHTVTIVNTQEETNE